MSRIAAITFGVLTLLVIGTSAAGPRPGEPSPDPLSRFCDYGVTLALSGHAARAESVFIALLSRSPGDARALNGLGNLHLWRGEPDVAAAFYREAGAADTTDAGIVLNVATAWMLAGDEDSARVQAEAGIRMAGGIRRAAGLLGLDDDAYDDAPDKGADPARMNREQALLLLHEAARALPPDTTGHVTARADSTRRAKGRRPGAWRSAGARGSEDTNAPPNVYWKR